MFSKDIGIDLGTANIMVYVRGKGVVISEPAVAAIDRATGRILAVGEEARQMIGRTPGDIIAIRPLKDGVIADYQITESMLKHFIQLVCGRRPLFKPRVVVCVPSGVTSVEKRAVLEAAMQAGAKEVYPISEPMAAAIGAGLDVGEASGDMLIDIGGGTTDIAVISLDGEVVTDSIRVGGAKFDDALVRYVRREFNLLIGERTAELCKIKLGNVYGPSPHKSMEIHGRDAVSGLPRTVEINQVHVAHALEESVRAIVQTVRAVLEKTPPELSADIIDKGIILTGGGAMIEGFSELIAAETRIPVHLADDPLACVALGTGKVLENIDRLRGRVLVAGRS